MNQVLVVDDSSGNLTLFKHLVVRLGDCEPVLFDRPVDALAWCRDHIPDLVVVDYMMPEMDGLQFTEAFRALHSGDEIPILMVTANDQKEVRYRALQGGANDFLNKPVDAMEFSARARNMLALRQGQKYLADRALHLAALVEEQTHQIRTRERELVYRLSRAAEFRDPETGAHIQRMAHYSRIIAEEFGLDEPQRKVLFEAAPMHDVGKIGIPDQILLKPGKLTTEEFEIMKGHARKGYDLLGGSASEVMQVGAEIALTHHEKFNGAGYPCGLAGTDIPIFGRITAVADVFDALTSERPYKHAWTFEESMDFLRRESGSHFDPRVVDAFMARTAEALEIQARFQDEEKVRL
jgi:putative two-component system response regulator